PADLDAVADPGGGARFADDGKIEAMALVLGPFEDAGRAVDAVGLLVIGDRERDTAGRRRFAQRRDEGGDAGLHVDRAAAVEHAIGDLRSERLVRRRLAFSGRREIGVAVEEQLPTRAAANP